MSTMSGIKDQAEIDAMRRRLYERGGINRPIERTVLHPTGQQDIPRNWPTSPSVPKPPAPLDPRTDSLTTPNIAIHHYAPRRRYRLFILLGAIFLFLVTLGVSGFYMFVGNNQISSDNISVSTTGPLTIGGGEVLPLEMTIENKNDVAIESVVLIVNYPAGTKSADDGSRDLLEDRITVGRLGAGETIKVPTKAVVFGEENQEREVHATVEYRLDGSNGTFYKEASPLTFKIISSPVVIRVESLRKVSSGQEIEVTLTIQSNAPNPLKDVLVTADYPTNFDFSSAVPSPAYRENAWLISELLPERATKIFLKGAIVGKTTEEFQIKFTAGTPKPDNQFMIGSLLAQAATDFVIEQPFIDVSLGVNGVESEVVTLKTGDSTNVAVTVRNTLEDTLYDMAVEVGIKGNVLVRDQVSVTEGYYDSVKDVIRFEPSGDSSLSQVAPGAVRTFSFALRPSDRTETPSFAITANAFARRVFENRATEQLVGTAKSEVKFTSTVAVGRELSRNNLGFIDSGPVPPVADTVTTYTVYLEASAGGNDVTGASLTTALPQYVNWTNQTTGDGSLVFNPVSKELTWTIGDIEASKKKTTAFQISVLPSQTQIDTTPAVVSALRFRATDRFTGAVVRADGLPLNTELAEEQGFKKGNGVVQATGSVAGE